MQTIEVTGKTLDEAKAAAAAKLGVPIEQVNVVSTEEQKGLFGKGTVKIRAEAEEAAPAKPAKPARGRAKAEPKAEPEPAAETAAVVEEAPAKPAKPARGRGKAAASVPEPAPAEPEAAGEEKPDVVASEEDERKIVAIVENLLKAGGLEGEVASSSRNGKYVNVVLDGKDIAHLVGKHGEVLNALQYLVNVTVTQQLHNGVRATIDGNDYRRKREEALLKLASNIAAEVARRGEEAVLDALPAFERRIVHKALAGVEGVTTYSEGEEPNRRVVIAPVE